MNIPSYGYTYEYFGDSTQLTYLRSRYYASGTGRFLTRDTWEGNKNSPLTLNHWNYVHSNPIMFTDPSGHIEIWEAGTANKIVLELKYNYQINIITDWGSFESGTNKFIGLVPPTLADMESGIAIGKKAYGL